MTRDHALEVASREAQVMDVMAEAAELAGFVRAAVDNDQWWRRPGKSPVRLRDAFVVATGEARAVLLAHRAAT